MDIRGLLVLVILVSMLTELHCPEDDCDCYLELRSNKYGDFYLCTNAPVCKGKMSSREVYRQEQLAKRKPQPIPDNIKKCPACGSAMMLRSRKDNGETFYGCSKYPQCRGSISDAARAIANMRDTNG